MKRVILFGGAGYIGVHLLMELHGNDKYQVVIIDVKSPPKEAVDFAEKRAGGLPVLHYIVDLYAETDVSRYLPILEDVECGIMLAAKKVVLEGEEIPFDYMRINTGITVNCLNYLLTMKVPKIIQASSSSIYHKFRIDGDPEGFYGFSKELSDRICMKTIKSFQSETYKPSLRILRYMNPIGTHASVKAFADVGICEVLRKINPDGSTILINRGNCIRDYIHITDLASYHRELLEEDWSNDMIKILNVGSGVRTSVAKFYETFSRVTGLKCKEFKEGGLLRCEGYDTTMPIEDHPKKWKPLVTLEEAVRDYITEH